MADWSFVNSERKRLGIRLNWKSVKAGEVYNQFTVLSDGRGKEWVQARCSCGNVDKYTAASLKGGGRKGGVEQCAGCDERAAEKLVWKHPEKWENTKCFGAEDKEIKRIQDERRKKKELARAARKDRYG